MVVGVKRAAQRKLEQELGIPPEDVPLSSFQCVSRIHYLAESDGIWGEHESTFLIPFLFLLLALSIISYFSFPLSFSSFSPSLYILYICLNLYWMMQLITSWLCRRRSEWQRTPTRWRAPSMWPRTNSGPSSTILRSSSPLGSNSSLLVLLITSKVFFFLKKKKKKEKEKKKKKNWKLLFFIACFLIWNV